MRWFFRAVKLLILGLALIAVMGGVVMSLWNFVVPPLTGWHALGFAQALALLLLCRILFGGFFGRARGAFACSPAFRGRWSRLSPEERAALRERFRGHRGCGRETPQETGKAPAA